MAMGWKCNLDPLKILTSYSNVDDSTLQAGDVWFPEKPDLPLGHYRWNGEQFEPANLGQVWYTPPGPDSWYAFFRALVHIQKNTAVDFPPPVKQWMRYYFNAFRRQNDPDPDA